MLVTKRKSDERGGERVTCGDADDLLDDSILGLLVLAAAPGVLLID